MFSIDLEELGRFRHPLPSEALTYDEARGGYVVNIDRSRLEGAPAYSESDHDMWADPNYASVVNSYYGV